MEAFKNLLNQLEIQKAEQRQREAQEATKQNELRKAQADLSLDEAIALYATQLEASTTAADLSLIHISEPTRQAEISYAVFCLKKKKTYTVFCLKKKKSLKKKKIKRCQHASI